MEIPLFVPLLLGVAAALGRHLEQWNHACKSSECVELAHRGDRCRYLLAPSLTSLCTSAARSLPCSPWLISDGICERTCAARPSPACPPLPPPHQLYLEKQHDLSLDVMCAGVRSAARATSHQSRSSQQMPNTMVLQRQRSCRGRRCSDLSVFGDGFENRSIIACDISGGQH